ncbi:probable cytochrome P450 CYP44 [Haliotis rufescens]|uniref:probable cytochrome P450 CYP44 n=1 Tax=Haliotis rufescens TaxID=6454 RepID=UPI00201EFE99|nr:probable cytochrome P450 CYP44 [Haliotis rufescens]
MNVSHTYSIRLCNNSCVSMLRLRTSQCHTCRRLRSTGALPTEEFTTVQAPKPFRDIPGPRGLPYLGSLLDYRLGRFKNVDKYQDSLKWLHAKYGKIVKQTVTGTTTVHVFDPDYFRTVYQHEGKIPYIPPLLESVQQYRRKRNMSPGLGFTNGEEWYRLRTAVQKMMMRPQEVTAYLPFTNQVASEFVSKIEKLRNEDDEVEDFENEMAKWSLESAAMNCFETRLGYLDDSAPEEANKMADANRILFDKSTKMKFSLPLHKFVITPTWKTILESEDYFTGNGLRLVEETAQEIKTLVDEGKLTENKYTFLAYLLSRKELSFKDVSIITLSLFGDGLSTTVPAALFNLYCLAAHPNVQQNLVEEIRAVVPQEGEISAKMIQKMPYLKACVKETFRFYPVGLDVTRIVQKDLVVGGYHIPAGTRVELNNFVLFKKPEYFHEPETFLPERWLRGGSAHDIHPFILTPFSHGPRMCAGRRFAEQDLYVLLTKILLRFQVEWHHKEMGQTFRMLMVPDCPARFSFTDRRT